MTRFELFIPTDGTWFFFPFWWGRQTHSHACLSRWDRTLVPYKVYNKYEIILVYDINVTGTIGSTDGVRNSRRWVSKRKFSSVGCLYDNAKSEIESRCGWPVCNGTPSIDKALHASCWIFGIAWTVVEKRTTFACKHVSTALMVLVVDRLV